MPNPESYLEHSEIRNRLPIISVRTGLKSGGKRPGDEANVFSGVAKLGGDRNFFLRAVKLLRFAG